MKMLNIINDNKKLFKEDILKKNAMIAIENTLLKNDTMQYKYESYQYALMLKFGDLVQANKEKAALFMKLACEATYKYAIMLDFGHGVPVDKKKAIEYYKDAAYYGNVEAMFDYALHLSIGDVIQ